MIDYLKLYNELGVNNAPIYIFSISIFIISTIFLIIILITAIYDNIKEKHWKNNIKNSILFFFSLIFAISLLSIGTFFLYRDFRTEPNKYITELKKYNVKNVENFNYNIEYLESEFEYHTEKEKKINKILNEFYKPTGKKLDTEIMKKLKK